MPPQATTAASYLDVVSMAATRSDDLRAAFSNTNSDVEIAAPAIGILSTKRGGYFTLNGTSMATPHVAGAAADIRARMSGESAATARSLLDTSMSATIALPLGKRKVLQALRREAHRLTGDSTAAGVPRSCQCGSGSESRATAPAKAQGCRPLFLPMSQRRRARPNMCDATGNAIGTGLTHMRR